MWTFSLEKKFRPIVAASQIESLGLMYLRGPCMATSAWVLSCSSSEGLAAHIERAYGVHTEYVQTHMALGH